MPAIGRRIGGQPGPETNAQSIFDVVIPEIETLGGRETRRCRRQWRIEERRIGIGQEGAVDECSAELHRRKVFPRVADPTQDLEGGLAGAHTGLGSDECGPSSGRPGIDRFVIDAPGRRTDGGTRSDEIDPCVGEQMLDRLERADGNAELPSLRRIPDDVVDGCGPGRDKIGTEQDAGDGCESLRIDRCDRDHIGSGRSM